MLNSVENEILNAYKYKNIKEMCLFVGSDKPRMLFFPPINVKKPTFVGIFRFMSRKISCSIELSIKSFITSGTGAVMFVKEGNVSKSNILYIGALRYQCWRYRELTVRGPEVIKLFPCSTVEHGILNAHKYKKIPRNSAFLGSDKPRMLFFPLINVKMPTIVGIFTFMSRKKFHAQLS